MNHPSQRRTAVSALLAAARRVAVPVFSLGLALVSVLAVPGAPARATTLSASTPTAADAVFVPVAPHRVMSATSFGAGTSRTLVIPGLPSGATAVQLTVTASRASTNTFISACAAGTPVLTCRQTSALNPTPRVDTATAALVALGGSAKNSVMLYNNVGTVQLVADISGYYVPAGTTGGSDFIPTTPYRAMQPRTFGARSNYTLSFPEAPAGAVAVALNLTGSHASALSFVSACPASQALSSCTSTSSLNVHPGIDVANLAIVKLSGSGNQVRLYNNSGTALLMADVEGFFVDSSKAPAGSANLAKVQPQRVLAGAAMGSGATTTVTLPNVPSGATAAVVNVTATAAAGASYVSACPTGTSLADCRESSTLNPRPLADTANNAVLKLGGPRGNQVTLYNNAGATRLFVDLQGYYVGDGSPLPEIAPAQPAPVTPGPSTTGVPTGTSLTRHDGDIVVTRDGTVLDGLDVHGYVVVKARNVVIRNSIVRGGTPTTYSRGLITVPSSAYSATVQDTEIVPEISSPYQDGLRGMNITATRLNIHGVVDQVHIYGDNVTITDSWLHDNAHFLNDPNHGGTPSHDDGVQIQVGRNITLRNNVITGSHNAAIMVTEDQGLVADLDIQNNLLDYGACVVNIKNQPTAPQNVRLADNTFGRHAIYPSCGIKMPNTSYRLALTGNYFTDGAPVTITR
ncbi:hypothetical protein Q6348_06250 [Isoptericola sp. b441]|uniref:Right handed beta helix domain-containing protein n=1 Tax=Actinotalea lenta TaxID=3064654 RepID=A0ABT9DCZ0_9CELL|nr:right-handed parallel beta-helix repeat-containing protein [Isoptericola sp. b441]MDO8106797.1 hypothetical protein [Isoptericola sp. b441]